MRVPLAAVVVLCLSCASSSPIAKVADPHAAVQPGDIRGCLAYWHSSANSFTYEPFVKVADKEARGEDGATEIWGFRTWNLEPPDKEGLTHPVNVPDDIFIPLGQFREVRAGLSKKATRCPPSYSGAESGVNAEDH